MALLDVMKKVAGTVITALGTDATLRRTTSEYDPEEDASSDTTTDYAVKITPPAGAENLIVNSDTVEKKEFDVQVAAQDLAVEPDAKTDVLVFQGRTYRITQVRPVWAGSVVAMYVVRCVA